MAELERHDRAGAILDAALRKLVEEGFDRLEAVQTMVAFGLDMLPAMVCQHHLAGEYQELTEAVADRIKEIPNLTPGKDVAMCTGH